MVFRSKIADSRVNRRNRKDFDIEFWGVNKSGKKAIKFLLYSG